MTQSIKLSSEQLGLMSQFQSISHITSRDCVVDDVQKRIIFIVNKGDLGLAIGKGGSMIKRLTNSIKQTIELVEYAEKPEDFIKNILGSKYVIKVRVNKRPDGSLQAVAMVAPHHKGFVVGTEGRHIKKARLLASRYFGINHISIDTNITTEAEE